MTPRHPNISARVALVAMFTVAVSLVAAPAWAAPAITEPTGNPYVVTLEHAGKPQPFTITTTGFPFRTPVFAEQCNGRPPRTAAGS